MFTFIFWTILIIVLVLAALWFSPKRGWAYGPSSTWCKITHLCWHEKPKSEPQPEPEPPLPPPVPPTPPVDDFDYPLPWAEASCLELIVHPLEKIERFFKLLHDCGIKMTKVITSMAWSQTEIFDGAAYCPSIYPVVKVEESEHGRFPVYNYLLANQLVRDKWAAIKALAKKYGLLLDITLVDGCSAKTQGDYGHRSYLWRSAVQFAEKWGGPLTGGLADDKLKDWKKQGGLKFIDDHGPTTIYYWLRRDAKFWFSLCGPEDYYTICNEFGPSDPCKKDQDKAEYDAREGTRTFNFHEAMTDILMSIGVPLDHIISNPLNVFSRVADLGTLMEFHGVSTARKLGEVKGLYPGVPFSRMVYNGDGPDKYATGIAEFGNRTRESSVAEAVELRAADKALNCKLLGTWLRSCEITGTPPKGGDLDSTVQSESMMRGLSGKT